MRLRREINRAARFPFAGRPPIRIATAARFQWDRFRVLQDTEKREIEDELGFRWPGPSKSAFDGMALALTHHRRVVAWSLFPARWGAFDCEMVPGGFSRRQARFFIYKSSTSYTSPRTRILIAKSGRNGQLSSHERRCLNVFGSPAGSPPPK